VHSHLPASPRQVGGAHAFVSGLTMPPASGKVVVSYGYANQEARALVMSEAFFDELFANASQCGANAK